MNSRVRQLHKVVEDLLPYHDDGELDAKLGEAAGRVADVALQFEELRLAGLVVARVVVETALSSQRTSLKYICYG